MKLFNTKEAALFITKKTGKSMSVRQVQHEIKLGKLPAKIIGRDYAIKENDLNRYQRRPTGRIPKSKGAK
jgi:hypothetical protein